MADISDVNTSVIKDLYQRLEGLSCTSEFPYPFPSSADSSVSTHHD